MAETNTTNVPKEESPLNTWSWLILPGLPAKDGKDGRDGLAGKDGKDGEDGKPGNDGADGLPGIDGADGLPGIDGLDGLPGIDGADGLPGIDGNDGEDGKPGKDCKCPELPGQPGEPGGFGAFIQNNLVEFLVYYGANSTLSTVLSIFFVMNPDPQPPLSGTGSGPRSNPLIDYIISNLNASALLEILATYLTKRPEATIPQFTGPEAPYMADLCNSLRLQGRDSLLLRSLQLCFQSAPDSTGETDDSTTQTTDTVSPQIVAAPTIETEVLSTELRSSAVGGTPPDGRI